MFWQIHWVEDEHTGLRMNIRAMEVWENVVNVLKHLQTLRKSEQPSKNNLYDTLFTHHSL